MSKSTKTTKTTKTINVAKRDARKSLNTLAKEKSYWALETPSFWKNRDFSDLSLSVQFIIAFVTREENKGKVLDTRCLNKQFLAECVKGGHIDSNGGTIKGKFAIGKTEMGQAVNWLYFNEKRLFTRSLTKAGDFAMGEVDYIENLIEERIETK